MAAFSGSRFPIHVAGVIDAAEAEMLLDCGVTHLGFPLALDYHKEDLSADAAAEIVTGYSHRGRFFLITYLDRAEDIVALSRKLGINMVQLHGKIAPAEIERLRALAPDFQIIK